MYTGWQKHGAMKFDQAKVYQSCLANSSKAKMKDYIHQSKIHAWNHSSIQLQKQNQNNNKSTIF